MASPHKGIFKEINGLQKNLSQMTLGQAVVDNFEYDDESMEHKIYVLIIPNDGYYKNAKTKFEIRFGSEYPSQAPTVTCLDKIYHPNIDLPDDEFGAGGSVCVNTLDTDWEPTIGLEGCILSILFLFYNPNPDDALSPVFGEEMDDETFADNVQKSIRGEEIEGVQFDRIIIDEKEYVLDVPAVYETEKKETVCLGSLNDKHINEDFVGDKIADCSSKVLNDAISILSNDVQIIYENEPIAEPSNALQQSLEETLSEVIKDCIAGSHTRSLNSHSDSREVENSFHNDMNAKGSNLCVIYSRNMEFIHTAASQDFSGETVNTIKPQLHKKFGQCCIKAFSWFKDKLKLTPGTKAFESNPKLKSF